MGPPNSFEVGSFCNLVSLLVCHSTKGAPKSSLEGLFCNLVLPLVCEDTQAPTKIILDRDPAKRCVMGVWCVLGVS